MHSLLRWTVVFLLACTSLATAQNTQYVLKIEPAGTSTGLLLVKPGEVVQFTARVFEYTANGTAVEVPYTSIHWAVTPSTFGVITAQGLFTAAQLNSSTVRGTVTATATVGSVTVQGSVALALDVKPAATCTFSGNVRSSSGPIAGAQVSVMGAANLPFMVDGKTDANGDFSIQVPPGTYIVRASAAGFLAEYFDDVSMPAQATRFVTDPARPVYDHIDFELGSGGSIAGVVTDGNGNPLADVVMAAWVNSRPATNAAGTHFATVSTDANGGYIFDALAPGDYIVRATAAGYIPEYYDDATEIANASAVTVAAQPVTGIDFELSAGGSIAGTVIDGDNNAPIASASVIVRSSTRRFERAARTDASGNYVIDGLPSGAYTVFASAYRYIGEYYGTPSSTNLPGTVQVTAPLAVTGIDFALAPAPVGPRRYRGTVASRNGTVALHAVVEALDPRTGAVIATSTDPQGAFDFEAWDDAIIRARALGHVGMYAGGTRDWKQSQWNGTQGGVSFVLEPVTERGMATLTGVVQDAATGDPLVNAWVYGFDAAGSPYFAVTGSDGGFSIPNTANGSLDLMISSVGYDAAGTRGEIDDGRGSTSVTAQRSGVTTASDRAGLPSLTALSQNYPNPFNPSTAIEISLPARVHVFLRVYDLLGREVATLANRTMDAGTHRLTMDATGLPSGVYLYRMEAGGTVKTRRMVVAK